MVSAAARHGGKMHHIAGAVRGMTAMDADQALAASGDDLILVPLA